jgi:GNAT superfamily N-acetyltransferase
MSSADDPAFGAPGVARRGATTSATIRRATFEEIVDLRHAVLRAGLPREMAWFEGDGEPSTRHYGAFLDGRNVGCATLHLNHWLDEPAWQLRGMAVAPDQQSTGLGRAILAFVEDDVKTNHTVRLMWCNARVPASRFYQRLGWQIVSEEFEVPTAGPHFRMVKRL